MFNKNDKGQDDQIDFSGDMSSTSLSSDPKVFEDVDDSWSDVVDDDGTQRLRKREERRRRSAYRKAAGDNGHSGGAHVLKVVLRIALIVIILAVVVVGVLVAVGKINEARHPMPICQGKVQCDAEYKRQDLNRATYDMDTKLRDLIDDMTTADRQSVKQSDVDAVAKSITKVEKLGGEFEKLPAMDNAGVKKAFTQYKARYERKIAYARDIMTVAPAASKANRICGKTPLYVPMDPTWMSQQSNYLTTCKAAVDAIPDVKNTDVASYKASWNAYATKTGETYAAIQELGPSDQFSSNQQESYDKLQRTLSQSEENERDVTNKPLQTLTKGLDDADEKDGNDSDLSTAIWDMVSKH
ncbi:hypothetical protein OZX57_03715 [Bifidobacterium sp. ESL0682]|uniref:hypothetical protein n=1 Tax=Bifidobacterium sp. ESL0682 TaxID=2983212 RepID=UPI0023F8E8AC|nr:hypothetical protein [Bifidobacterium sp. ESL0682]WEV42543.1 hypothetical protein OZX57_03715 [Bifidobacterium sp. ESL0682]